MIRYFQSTQLRSNDFIDHHIKSFSQVITGLIFENKFKFSSNKYFSFANKKRFQMKKKHI